jgi:predicted ATPase
MMGDRFVVISGCSGGGKSTLLAELVGRGYAAVEEPGRRIVEEELAATDQHYPGLTGRPSLAGQWQWRWPIAWLRID